MEFKFWIIVLRIQVTIGNDSWMTGNSVPRLDLSFGFIVLHCNCHDRQASYGFPLLDRRIVSIFFELHPYVPPGFRSGYQYRRRNDLTVIRLKCCFVCLNYLPSYLADYSFYSLPTILSNWRRLFGVIGVISGIRLEQSYFCCN